MLSQRKIRLISSLRPGKFLRLILMIFISSTTLLFLHSRSAPSTVNDGGDVSETHSRGKRGIVDATSLNNTRHAVKEILFFNRVAKVGSQTIMSLMSRLSIQNNFQLHWGDGKDKFANINLPKHKEKNLTTMIDSLEPPSTFVKHSCFSNFTEFSHSMPIYINMVREPVERAISWFYYTRAPWYIIERKVNFPDIPPPNPKWLKKDFETCVRTGDPECRFNPGDTRNGLGDHRRQLMFFCGHEERCVEFNGKWALQEAKRHVEENYAVVGVLEQMNLTLQVFEKYVPRFFKGAFNIYHENLETLKETNKNEYKKPVSEEIKNILRRNFTREIEFYEFCKQRLFQQHHAAFNGNVGISVSI